MMSMSYSSWGICLFSFAILIESACVRPHNWQPIPHLPSINPPTKDFTLIWEKEDANGLPQDPYWGLEKISGEFPPREQTEPSYPCKSDPYGTACTENKNLVMDPPQFPNSVICKVGNLGAKFNGHADWIVASQHGCVDWENQSADGDYNFRMFPDDRQKAALTKNNDQFLGLEFDYYETILNSRLDFWSAFRSEVNRENDDQHGHEQEIRRLLHPSRPDVNPRSAVTGVFGLDCEHGCKSEIHPVLAFAIETNPDPDDDTWVIFVRNWGDEGFCSRYRHIIDFEGNQLAILLFDNAESVGPSVIREKTHMFATNGTNIAFPSISDWRTRGPVVSFTLPSPEQTMAFVELEIHFKWHKFTVPSCSMPMPALAISEVTAEPSDAEQYLRDARRKLKSQDQSAVNLPVPLAATTQTSLVEMPVPETIRIRDFVTPARPVKSVKGVPRLVADRKRAERDIRGIQDLCRAYKNTLPPFRGHDISSEVCDETKLHEQMRANQK